MEPKKKIKKTTTNWLAVDWARLKVVVMQENIVKCQVCFGYFKYILKLVSFA